ncbi:MAG: hypothetical protein OEM26_01755, partial [Saprospiraceae bacterium]|nr:hypothetical protein [Saprospiraceae bacterium]
EGRHSAVNCSACHQTLQPDQDFQFSEIASNCTDCHDDIHVGQFDIRGITDCKRCHGFENWTPSRFSHDETAFILEGAHLSTPCRACHTTSEVIGSTEIVIYQIADYSCAACHY